MMDDKTLVSFGGEVKALPGGKVGGHLVRFSTPQDPDLTGDYFDAQTDFGDIAKTDVYYHHGLDAKLKTRVLGRGDLKRDEVGIWIEAQLNLRDEYEKQIYELAKAGKLGWSSGTASHLVEREPVGKAHHIKTWKLGLDASLTPTPAEPRNTVIELKSLQASELLEPQASAEVDADHVNAQAADTQSAPKENTNTSEVKMDEKQNAAPEEKKETLDVAAELKAMREELKAMKSAPAENAGAPAIKKVTELGFKDDEMKSFLHWLRTGDDQAYKAAMQGQTDSEGGYAVPDDFYNQVVAKRNEVSVMRQAGVQVFPTSLDRVLVPIEDTAATKFVVTAEEGSYSENEPTLAQVAITVHKMTKLIKMSEELEMDAKANFAGYIASVWGRTLGLAENYYFCNVAANGSSQPQSVTYASTATTAVASQTAFTAAELLTLIYTVPSGYSNRLALLMRRTTLGAIRALSGNPFSFIPTPDGAGSANTASGSAGTVHGIPVYVTDDLPAQAAANKPVVVFNPDFYMIVEREGLTVSRNPWLYQASGQIGYFARARLGGALLQAEAAYHLLSKT